MSHTMIRQHLVQSWIELPMLVDQFVQRVAPALRCSREQLRGFICEELDLQNYEALGRVCRIIAEIYEVVSKAHDDVDVVGTHFGAHQTGLAAAVVSAWHEGGDDVAALQGLDQGGVEPMKVLPWRIWSEWNEGEFRDHPPSQGESNEEVRKEEAYGVLSDFMKSCLEWRDQILAAYTLVREGTPVGLTAMDEASDLLRHVCAAETEGLEDRVRSVLGARGFAAVALDNVRQRLERTTAPEDIALKGRLLKRYEAMLERVEAGEGVIQVRELRDLFRWLPPELVDGCYDDGPCMWQVLARMNEDAYVEMSTGGEDNSLCPFATVYVERDGEIAEVLRCNGTGGQSIWVVSREEALKKGVAQVAGWYAIRWWS